MANLPIKYVKDDDGKFLPITSPNAVINGDGKTMDEVFLKESDIPLGFINDLYSKTQNTTDFGEIAHQGDLIDFLTQSQIISLSLSKIYPVGSVYLSIQNTSPASFLGGSWTQIGAGYALWTANTGAGETISAGVPNITGSFGSNQDVGASGAFYVSSTGVKNSGTSKYASVVQFNASRSSGVYGASSTVQPPAYKVYAWRRTS